MELGELRIENSEVKQKNELVERFKTILQEISHKERILQVYDLRDNQLLADFIVHRDKKIFYNEFCRKYKGLLQKKTSDTKVKIISSWDNEENFSCEKIKESDIAFIEEYNVLGKDSAHQVFFGEINIGDSSKKVVVKPYTNTDDCSKNYSRAFYELTSLCLVRRIGIPAPEPLFVLFSDKEAFLIMSRENIIDLAAVNWNPLGTAISAYYHSIERLLDIDNEDIIHRLNILKSLGKFLAKLHTKRLFRLDSQLKNFALENSTNQFMLIDLETLELSPESEPLVTNGHLQKKCSRDLYFIFLSLILPRKDNFNNKGLSGINLFNTIIQKTIEKCKENQEINNYFNWATEKHREGNRYIDTQEMSQEIKNARDKAQHEFLPVFNLIWNFYEVHFLDSYIHQLNESNEALNPDSIKNNEREYIMNRFLDTITYSFI